MSSNYKVCPKSIRYFHIASLRLLGQTVYIAARERNLLFEENSKKSKFLDNTLYWEHKYSTVCPRSSNPSYIVTYYIKWVTTSSAYSSRNGRVNEISIFWYIAAPYVHGKVLKYFFAWRPRSTGFFSRFSLCTFRA